MTDLALSGAGYAEVNWSRWIVRCPRPYCTSALRVEIGEPAVTCWECGLLTPVIWPPDPIAIAAILAARPVPRTRNWLPGEPLEVLLEENVAHGLIPAGWTGVLLETIDGTAVAGLVADALPVGRPMLQIADNR